MVHLNSIKLARMKRGLRQMDLAVQVGTSESMVAKWETDRLKPSAEMYEKLAAVLGVDANQLKEAC